MNDKYKTKLFISKAKKIHGSKYDYSQSKYVNIKTKVKIICPIHGVFEQLPNNHILKAQRCPACTGNKKKTTSSFIVEANKIHKNKYDYSLVKYKNNQTKIIIKCPKHGEFERTPSSHLMGRGCYHCALENKRKSKYTTTEIVEQFRKIHGNTYDYSKVN